MKQFLLAAPRHLVCATVQTFEMEKKRKQNYSFLLPYPVNHLTTFQISPATPCDGPDPRHGNLCPARVRSGRTEGVV